MTWRSLVITQPAHIKLKNTAICIVQEDGEVSVPLEDTSSMLIDSNKITITSQLLSACSEHKVAVITVGANHHPNGVLLPYQSHSRALKVLKNQIGMAKPFKKRLWQLIVKQKIINQGAVLKLIGCDLESARLSKLASDVMSGDTTNRESKASQFYFPILFGKGFSRKAISTYNSHLNYGYSVLRAAIARSVVSYGFISSLGLHHCNEQNQFNLVDDLMEVFRPLIDYHVIQQALQIDANILTPTEKASIIEVLHQDVHSLTISGQLIRSSLLATIDALVISFGRAVDRKLIQLHLPVLNC